MLKVNNYIEMKQKQCTTDDKFSHYLAKMSQANGSMRGHDRECIFPDIGYCEALQ